MSGDRKRVGDEELVRMAQAGSTEAFGSLYQRHAPGVSRALASFAGPDRDLLDDLVQEVFLRVVNGLPGYRPSHPFPHWLYTIALNVGRNHARRASKIVSVEAPLLEAMAGVDDPMDRLAEATQLMSRVARLPLGLREVVGLRVGSDMGYGEIAELLGIPEGTARRRMHQAMLQLREELGAANRRRSHEGG